MPQHSRQARASTDSGKCLAAEIKEMGSVIEEKVIRRMAMCLPPGVVAISTMFVYALEWILANTIDRYKASWVVHGFLEIPDVHYNPLTTHALVASDSSLMVLLSLTVHYELIMKRLDAKTAYSNSPLDHEAWDRFPVGCDHPSGHAFALLHKSVHGLK